MPNPTIVPDDQTELRNVRRLLDDGTDGHSCQAEGGNAWMKTSARRSCRTKAVTSYPSLSAKHGNWVSETQGVGTPVGIGIGGSVGLGIEVWEGTTVGLGVVAGVVSRSPHKPHAVPQPSVLGRHYA